MHLVVLLGVLVACSLVATIEGCTTFVLGKKATADGSTMATHSNDGGGTTDARVVKVAAQDHAPGSMRPIHASPENYPRYVGRDRNISQYFKENCQAGEGHCEEFEPIGFIPQVEHTFAYFEATYGIMNEHQVGLGEATCSGVFAASSIAAGGSALLSVDQLSELAMERSTTAREAVSIMGALAENYGFYGESTSFEGGSESLVVIDPQEAWVFHILADPTGTSAIWVAARVPDDSVAVVANMFSIRVIDLADTANFLGRQDMWDIARTHGLWEEGQPMDFTKTFSDGEYAHKYYSGRRMWGVFHLFAPSQQLPAEYENLKDEVVYPSFVPVDAPVSIHDAFAAMRYWYNGTTYSTSADGNFAGGAFSSPDRYGGGKGEQEVSGSWERTIAIYRSSDSFVVQARAHVQDGALGGVLWFGPHAAHGTVYTPLLLAMDDAPDCLSWTYQGRYNMSNSFWAFRNVLNLAQIKFSYIIQDVQAAQHQLEAASVKLVHELTTGAHSASDSELITGALTKNAEAARDRFIALLHELFFKFGDGYVSGWDGGAGPGSGTFHASSVGYPAWWLSGVGYSEGPAAR